MQALTPIQRLISYTLDGSALGCDIITWEDASLGGNEPFKILTDPSAAMPAGYTDISSIKCWNDFGTNVANDYVQVKYQINNLVTDTSMWANLSEYEKDLSIQYYSYGSPTQAIIHMMTIHGLSQPQAQGFLIRSWHTHHVRLIEAFKSRLSASTYVIPFFLNFSDGEDLFDTIRNLIYDYTELGILGINFGDNNDGIMDYFNSTNGFTGQGLEENNYVLLQGTWSDFKSQLRDILVYGIYMT